MAKKVCSFCGRTENEVKLLITGLNGFICESCAEQAHEIVLSTGLLGNEGKGSKPFQLKKVPKPKEIKNTYPFLCGCVVFYPALVVYRMLKAILKKRREVLREILILWESGGDADEKAEPRP